MPRKRSKTAFTFSSTRYAPTHAVCVMRAAPSLGALLVRCYPSVLVGHRIGLKSTFCWWWVCSAQSHRIAHAADFSSYSHSRERMEVGSFWRRSMWFSGAMPTHARKTFLMQLICRNRALTTGVFLGTRGALMHAERMLRMGSNLVKVSEPSGLISMRWQSSVRIARSRIKGEANRESSHVLCITIVLSPPMKILVVYSSRARLLSRTNGTYFITTRWSGFSPG
mmetsp:Transcript_34911/g.67917  ORF Transcript_34911/g.67917 Transcript_34911/m.67917 type:complete len:224 (+) Transcript_34911:49-720(+)